MPHALPTTRVLTRGFMAAELDELPSDPGLPGGSRMPGSAGLSHQWTGSRGSSPDPLVQLTFWVWKLWTAEVLVRAVAPEKTSNFSGTVLPPLTVFHTPLMSTGGRTP